MHAEIGCIHLRSKTLPAELGHGSNLPPPALGELAHLLRACPGAICSLQKVKKIKPPYEKSGDEEAVVYADASASADVKGGWQGRVMGRALLSRACDKVLGPAVQRRPTL